MSEDILMKQMKETGGRVNPSTIKMLNDMGFLVVKAASPQPIFDEAKERELFESAATSALGRDSDGYYIATDTYLRWQGWLACAHYRAKAGEVGHE